MPISWNNLKESTPKDISQSDKTNSERPTSEIAVFTPRDPIFRLDDVVMNDNLRNQFRILISRIKNHKLLYDDWGLKRIDPQGTRAAISFYGPPGTGKTSCVEALASELGKQIIEVSYAEIESRWVGETGKNIRNAFKTARETDSFLFFDEADAILGARMSNVTQAADHAVNVARAVMLKELDAFDGVVAFATNKFGKYDRAFLRRILQHVEIPLPDKETRRQLWQKLVVESIPGRTELDWEQLAEESENMSGGDIKNCVVVACSESLIQDDKNPRLRMDTLTNVIERIRTAYTDHDNGK